MRSLTREEAKALGRRAQQPTRAPGELLAVWVSGKLVNGKNASKGWQMKAWGRYKREWREQVARALLEASWRPQRLREDRIRTATNPKRIVFAARTHGAMDSDGLGVALAPVRDALIECWVIHNDDRDCGHEFVYTQVIDRARRGVEVRVSLRKDGA